MAEKPTFSADGRWWWDGQQWQPIPAKPPLFQSQPVWLTLLCLAIFPPVGLLMLWTQTWPLWLKMLLTVASGLLFMHFVASRLA